MNRTVAICLSLVAIVTGYYFLAPTSPSPKREIYFFSASWCPTCQEACTVLHKNPEKIPSHVTLKKVDFDSATELKQKHNVTQPHTFIVIDEEGQEVSRFSGDEIKEKDWNLPSL